MPGNYKNETQHCYIKKKMVEKKNKKIKIVCRSKFTVKQSIRSN